MLRDVQLRYYDTQPNMDKIRAVAGNPNLQPDQVLSFDFIIANDKLNRNHSVIHSDGQKKAVDKWVGLPILYRDHDDKTVTNQIGRIYNAFVETRGDGVYTLGRGYSVRTDDLKDILSKIENGINREMSCAYEPIKSVCSKCNVDLVGNSRTDCPQGHIPRDGHIVDLEFTPAHLSFVARPAVDNAGVIHAQEIANLRLLADDGRVYRSFAEQEFIKWFSIKNPAIDAEEVKKMANKMTAQELLRLAGISEQSFRETIGDGSQLVQMSEEPRKESIPVYKNVKDIFNQRRKN